MPTYSVEVLGRELQKGKSPSGIMKFEVSGTDSQAIAYGLVLTASPSVYEGLFKQSVIVRETGPYLWDGTASYGILEPGNPGDDPSWNFEITGQNTHITQAEEHLNDYGLLGRDTVDWEGAINVHKDGKSVKVHGCEIYTPVFTWDETHYVPLATFTDSYIQTLEAHISTINEDPFRIWTKGEILLLGVNGSKRAKEAVPLTFRFASSRTRTNMVIGDVSGVDKEGWAYLWIEYQKQDKVLASGKNMTIQKVVGVHTERVYRYSDFSELGVPDPWNKS